MKPTRVFAPLVALACFFNVSCAPVTEEATRELGAQEYGLSVLRILPDGWQLMECRVDDAPSRWSGRTRALVARFRHESLKSAGDGSSTASFMLWRTPSSYPGTLLPLTREQAGEARALGKGPHHRWFIGGSYPDDEHWEPVRNLLLQALSITMEIPIGVPAE